MILDNLRLDDVVIRNDQRGVAVNLHDEAGPAARLARRLHLDVDGRVLDFRQSFLGNALPQRRGGCGQQQENDHDGKDAHRRYS